MDQLLAHLFGDYVIQNDWMASNKTQSSKVCLIHAVTYGIPFLFLTRSLVVLLISVATQFVIGRWRLALQLVRLKNWNWSDTGFPGDRPVFLTVWITILVDNAIHLLINYLALKLS